ncbi:hypothetical protein SELMODRAFT_425149 [Selaginella moellendorffii]|uniref:Uncharacterized protein n=1 Tax=Selaginella moellendorffii TaxID=88036 RepID=D8SS60_SELML|nr:hypothetical protein SELMODRAFT_425149 [Selaginella moellendorffii]
MDSFLMAAQAPWISRTNWANHFSCAVWHIGALVYTTNVFLMLLTSGKKLGMYEPKFHCPTILEQLHNEDSKKMSEKPPNTLYTDIRSLSLTGSVGNMEIVIGDYFQLFNDISQESFMFHRWMRGLGMNNTFSIDLAFFNLLDGLPPLQDDTPSWNIL